MKDKVVKFLPPILLDIYKKLFKKYGWFGNYVDWSLAMKDSSGYNSPIILDKTKETLLKVINRDDLYERDSVLLDNPQYPWHLITFLLWIATKNNCRLRILDFGGSLGSSYFQCHKYLDDLLEVSWNIVEQLSYVEVGNKFFANDQLKFHKTIEDCIEQAHPDTIVLSSVLPYLKNPYDILSKLMSYKLDYIFIDRTPLIDSNNDRLTVQKVPPSIYKASYPCWFFSRQKFIEFIEEQEYTILTEFDALAGLIDLGDIVAKDKGFILEKKVRYGTN